MFLNVIAWMIVFFLFLYTAGYAFTLWKEKNTPGAAAVFLLAIAIAILPFFSLTN